MKINIPAVALAFLIFPFLVSAADDDTVYFPGLEGWNLSVSRDVYTPSNLWDLIDGAAEAYLAYDFIDLHLADYENPEGITIHAEVYRHSSLNNAYGIYASERSPDYRFLDLGGQAYLDKGVLNCFSGPFYMKFYSTDEAPDVQESLIIVAGAVVERLAQGKEFPGLVSLFPQEGKSPYSDHYIAKNFIGFGFLHSAFTMDYDEGYKLFIIKGKNRDEILEMAGRYLAFTKQETDPARQTSFTVADPYNGSIPVVVSGRYLTGIINGAGNNNAKMKLGELVKNLESMPQ